MDGGAGVNPPAGQLAYPCRNWPVARVYYIVSFFWKVGRRGVRVSLKLMSGGQVP
jgi:hypothetical protein